MRSASRFLLAKTPINQLLFVRRGAEPVAVVLVAVVLVAVVLADVVLADVALADMLVVA